jgi:hypothetical protein
MNIRSFKVGLWERDKSLLGASEQELAQYVLDYACNIVGCSPYHRSSKAKARSDYQTLIRHPRLKKVCLVISVVPPPSQPARKVLRIDFFDRKERVKSACGPIMRAPSKQWSTKYERRLVVSPGTGQLDLRQLVDDVVGYCE